MNSYIARYNYDTTIEGTYEGKAEDEAQFEFELMNEVRDMDPAARNVQVLDIQTVAD